MSFQQYGDNISNLSLVHFVTNDDLADHKNIFDWYLKNSKTWEIWNHVFSLFGNFQFGKAKRISWFGW